MDERPSRGERIVRWSVENPFGWMAFQFAQVIVAAGLVRLVGLALGDRASSSVLWGLFAAIVLVLAVLSYLLRRRILAELGDSQVGDDRDGAS
jgi:hypothetical protein